MGAVSSSTAAFTESWKKVWKQEVQPGECAVIWKENQCPNSSESDK